MTFSLARIATAASAHPLGLAFWQVLGGGLVLLLCCLVRRRWPKLGRANLTHGCVIAVLGSVVPASLYFYAAPHVPAGVLAITLALVPIFTYAFSWLLKIDSFKCGRSLGIVMGFIAIALLVIPETSLPHPSMAKWLVLPLVATVFYSLENVYVDIRIPRYTDMIELLSVALLIAALMLAPIIYQQQAFYPINLPLDNSEIAILAMMVVSSTAYVMFFYIVKIAGAVFASLMAYIGTLSGVLWGMWFFSERHSLWIWGALAVLLVSMLLVTPRHSAGLRPVVTNTK